MEALRLATWNLERKKPTGPTGRPAVDLLHDLGLDVMVLTEARTSFPEREGHVAVSRPIPWAHLQPDERRVALWSRNSWEDVDDLGDAELPVGRFVSGRTQTSIGPVRIVGICIPWHMSNVAMGDRNRRAWEDHLRFLEVLPAVLARCVEPVVVAGDFNQRIPRVAGRLDVAEAMAACFDGFDIATAGAVQGVERPLIDHIALGAGMRARSVVAWPKDRGGVRMSDHDGVLAEVDIDPPGRRNR